MHHKECETHEECVEGTEWGDIWVSLGTMLLSAVFEREIRANGGKPVYTVVAPKTLRPNADYHIYVSLYDIPAPIEMVATVIGPAHSVSTGAVTFNTAESKVLTLAIGDWPEGPTHDPFTYKLQVKGKGAYFTTVYEKPVQHNHNNSHPIPTNETTSEGLYLLLCELILGFSHSHKYVCLFGYIFGPLFHVNSRQHQLGSDQSNYNTPIDIHIKDGNGKRVIEWTKLYPKNGIISEELQLSGQPVFGNWTIVAEALERNTTKAFTVADYELPTFNVEVVLPTYATRNRSEVTATVKAFDANGKAVKGDLTFEVTSLKSSL
ncbi:unnamed protein product [Medioppia subpectinata]|uniref:Macroglobulin domain-containing protein n=1 Tax=Medioppia subpectinata TaxID=1979941 RepID=A0A7R9KTD1_9ACAR|nr:unnamed protein product [Medioppia subpectinata]CAG2109155.1 unnamed protein product [Medioppia subpectinata]